MSEECSWCNPTFITKGFDMSNKLINFVMDNMSLDFSKQHLNVYLNDEELFNIIDGYCVCIV